MCNNSDAGPTSLTGGQEGFEVGVGYDQVTGLGSLDVGKFFAAYVPFKPPVASTEEATDITATTASLTGKVNPDGQATQYWFVYSTKANATGGFETPLKTVSGTSQATVTIKIAELIPGTKYYFQLVATSLGGTVKGSIDSFTTPKAAQTISFKQPTTPVTYGVKPIELSARSTSPLPVVFKVLSGHASLSGSTLTITGAGIVVVQAADPGNSSYLPAAKVTRSITVNKGLLAVTAHSLTMKQGAKVPPLTYVMSGFVKGDTQAKDVKGAPALSTTATSKSTPGKYPITVAKGTLTASNYTFKFVNGKLTVTP
jgi:hypothetical protein